MNRTVTYYSEDQVAALVFAARAWIEVGDRMKFASAQFNTLKAALKPFTQHGRQVAIDDTSTKHVAESEKRQHDSESCAHDWVTYKHWLDVESNCYVLEQRCSNCNAEYASKENQP